MEPDTGSPPITVSMGEPGGIGPEIILSAYEHCRVSGPLFFVFGDPHILAARNTGDTRIREISSPAEAADAFGSGLPVIPLENRSSNKPGTAGSENAAAVIESIERCVAAIRTGEASALVTAPIQKKPLYDAGFRHPGHTEFLAELADLHWPGSEKHISVMMLAGPDLKTVPVTCHIPLAEVPTALTKDLIIRTATRTAEGLARWFGNERPVIAVTGLNPHAGEAGALGREDDDVIAPAIETLRKLGHDVSGPFPADTLFHAAARRKYDVALAMYHDQALIPVKALAFDETVNVTLGLPFLRTSPDHGTALDIAGQGTAKPDSMIAAIRLAASAARETD